MAYAQARGGANVDANEEIGEGGSLATGMEALTTNGIDTDTLSLTALSTTREKLQRALNGRQRKMVTAAISSENDLHIPSHHAYTVTAWDGTRLTIRNPWGHMPSEVP